MIDCNICKHKEDYDYCIECRHGELFERKNVSEPKKYQLVAEENIADIADIADIVVICVNMLEDTKSFIVLGVADLI